MNGKPWRSEYDGTIGFDWSTTDGDLLSVSLYPNGNMAWAVLTKTGERPHPTVSGVTRLSPEAYRVLAKLADARGEWTAPAKPTED